jgi:hypothetical protein
LPKTELLKIKGDWEEVVNDCRSTVGKEALGHTPSPTFKKKILLAEHSPIRDISFKWKWENIKSWITVHWVRHKWECFVRSQRTDRTGVDRDKMPQDALVDFTGEANVQHLIDTMRKRLCYQAAPETRAYAEDLKKVITEREPEIGNVLVPNCIYRGGCPEIHSCGLYSNFWHWAMIKDRDDLCDMSNIQRRYDLYHSYIAERSGKA